MKFSVCFLRTKIQIFGPICMEGWSREGKKKPQHEEEEIAKKSISFLPITSCIVFVYLLASVSATKDKIWGWHFVNQLYWITTSHQVKCEFT